MAGFFMRRGRCFMLMKVMRRCCGDFKRKWLDVFRFDGYDVVLVLKHAIDQKKWVIYEHEAVSIKHLWGNNNVANSRFIFES